MASPASDEYDAAQLTNVINTYLPISDGNIATALFKEQLESTTDNCFKKALLQSLNERTQTIIRNREREKTKVVIRENLDHEQENLLSDAYQNFFLEFKNVDYNAHSMAAAMRKLELLTLLQNLNYDKYVEHQVNTDDLINDIGGNWLTHLMAQNKNIHSCCPILNNYDDQRHSTRVNLLNTSISNVIRFTSWQEQSIDLIRKNPSSIISTPLFCNHKAQNCTRTAAYGIMCHSSYDIPLRVLGDIMKQKNMQMVQGCFIFTSEMLLNDEGFIEPCGVYYKYVDNKKRIEFSFKNDASFNYIHDVSIYLSYVTFSIFYSTDMTCKYYLELMENRLGVQYFKIVKSMHCVIDRSPICHNLWFKNWEKKIFVKFFRINKDKIAQCVKLFDNGPTVGEGCILEPVVFTVDIELVERGMDYAIRVAEEKFKPIDIYNYLTMVNHKVIFAAKDIVKKDKPETYSKLWDLANAIYLVAYILKYDTGKTVQTVLNNIKFDRELRTKSLFSKIIARRPKNDYYVTTLFPCLHNYVYQHKKIKHSHMVSLVENIKFLSFKDFSKENNITYMAQGFFSKFVRKFGDVDPNIRSDAVDVLEISSKGVVIDVKHIMKRMMKDNFGIDVHMTEIKQPDDIVKHESLGKRLLNKIKPKSTDNTPNTPDISIDNHKVSMSSKSSITSEVSSTYESIKSKLPSTTILPMPFIPPDSMPPISEESDSDIIDESIGSPSGLSLSGFDLKNFLQSTGESENIRLFNYILQLFNLTPPISKDINRLYPLNKRIIPSKFAVTLYVDEEVNQMHNMHLYYNIGGIFVPESPVNPFNIVLKHTDTNILERLLHEMDDSVGEVIQIDIILGSSLGNSDYYVRILENILVRQYQHLNLLIYVEDYDAIIRDIPSNTGICGEDLYVQRSKGDGNCLYYSINQANDIQFVHDIKSRLKNYEPNPDNPFFNLEDFEIEKNELTLPGTQTVYAISDILATNICVHSPIPYQRYTTGQQHNKTVHILYNGVNHYDALIPAITICAGVDKNVSQLILSKTLKDPPNVATSENLTQLPNINNSNNIAIIDDLSLSDHFNYNKDNMITSDIDIVSSRDVILPSPLSEKEHSANNSSIHPLDEPNTNIVETINLDMASELAEELIFLTPTDKSIGSVSSQACLDTFGITRICKSVLSHDSTKTSAIPFKYSYKQSNYKPPSITSILENNNINIVHGSLQSSEDYTLHFVHNRIGKGYSGFAGTIMHDYGPKDYIAKLDSIKKDSDPDYVASVITRGTLFPNVINVISDVTTCLSDLKLFLTDAFPLICAYYDITKLNMPMILTGLWGKDMITILNILYFNLPASVQCNIYIPQDSEFAVASQHINALYDSPYNKLGEIVMSYRNEYPDKIDNIPMTDMIEHARLRYLPYINLFSAFIQNIDEFILADELYYIKEISYSKYIFVMQNKFIPSNTPITPLANDLYMGLNRYSNTVGPDDDLTLLHTSIKDIIPTTDLYQVDKTSYDNILVTSKILQTNTGLTYNRAYVLTDDLVFLQCYSRHIIGVLNLVSHVESRSVLVVIDNGNVLKMTKNPDQLTETILDIYSHRRTCKHCRLKICGLPWTDDNFVWYSCENRQGTIINVTTPIAGIHTVRFISTSEDRFNIISEGDNIDVVVHSRKRNVPPSIIERIKDELGYILVSENIRDINIILGDIVNLTPCINSLRNLLSNIYLINNDVLTPKKISALQTLNAKTSFNPKYVVEVDVPSTMKNCMTEISEIWKYTNQSVINNVKEMHHVTVQAYNGKYLTTDFSCANDGYGLYDNKLLKWIYKPKTGYDDYAYAFDGVNLIPRIPAIKGVDSKLKFDTTQRLLSVTRDMRIMNANDFIIKTRAIDTDYFYKRQVEIIVHLGVAGCGKSSKILSTAKPYYYNADNSLILSDIILTTTKENAAQLRIRYCSKHGISNSEDPVLKRKIRTGDSYLLNSVDKCDVLWIDEALMKHFGEICYYITLSGASKVHIYGDQAQIPYLNRIQQIQLHCETINKLPFATEYMLVSYRCPLDVIAILNSHNSYPFDAKTSSKRTNTCKIMRISNLSEVPKFDKVKYLTFTQPEKKQLEDFGFDEVSTIHEYQGNQHPHICLVRLNVKNITTFDSITHILVALTRHTHSFTYCTTVDTDTLCKYILTPITDFDLRTATATERDLDKDKMTGGYISDENIITLPKPINIIRVQNDIKALVSRHGLFNLMPMKVKKKYTLPLCQNYVNVKAPQILIVDISILQEFYINVFPRSALIDDKFDYEIVQRRDWIIPCDGFSATLNAIPRLSKRDTLSPVLLTNVRSAVPNTTLQIVKAFADRNGNVPDLTGLQCSDELIASGMDKFKSTYIYDTALYDAYADNPINANAHDIYAWILEQDPNTMNQVKLDLEMLHHKDLRFYGYTLKRLPKPILDDTAGFKIPSPQTIAFHDKLINSLFCPLVREMKRRLQVCLKSNYIINSDISPAELQDALNNIFPPRLAAEYGKFLEVDFSKYDKSQGYIIRLIEDNVMKILGFPQDLLPLWHWAHTYTYLINLNSKFKAPVHYQRKSGDAMTYFGNTIVLMFVLNVIYDLRDTVSLFSGDDSFIFSKIDISQSHAVDALAQLFNLEAKLLTYDYPYFCSKFVIPVNPDEWLVVPDLVKLVAKLGRKDLVDWQHVEEYRVSLLDLCQPFANACNNLCISEAVSNRYGTSKDISLVIATLYNLVSDSKAFRNLYYLAEGDVLLIDPSRPKLEI